jgi:DNA anti-recombination protein RmuC
VRVCRVSYQERKEIRLAKSNLLREENSASQWKERSTQLESQLAQSRTQHNQEVDKLAQLKEEMKNALDTIRSEKDAEIAATEAKLAGTIYSKRELTNVYLRGTTAEA